LYSTKKGTKRWKLKRVVFNETRNSEVGTYKSCVQRNKELRGGNLKELCSTQQGTKRGKLKRAVLKKTRNQEGGT